MASCHAETCEHSRLGAKSEMHSEDGSLDADNKFITFGDTANFGLQLRLIPEQACEIEPEQSVNSWGEWRLWVANVNLCTLQIGTKAGMVEVEEARWFLAPFFRWIVDNWMPLLHEKRLPPGGRLGDSRPRSARAAYLAMLQSAGDDFSRFHGWQEWAVRHSLRAASEGGIFPDVFFQRMEDEIEISWGDRVQPGADAATFVVEDGIARATVDEVATTLFGAVQWFLTQDRVCASEWGTELANQWNEMRDLPVGEVALSWYLDSSPEPKSLTETFTTAMEQLGRPLELAGKSWLADLSPEVAMFGDLAPNISGEASARLLAEFFGARTGERTSELLRTQIRSDEPAWSNSSPWHSGYSYALDVLDEVDPDPDSAMTKLEDMLTNLGVTVRNVRLGEEGPRGVALAGGELRPTILVNEDHTRNKSRGRRFTLAHELCHILLDQGRARPLAHSSTPWASPSVEQRANAFAAMLLMPPGRAKRPMAACPADLKLSINRMADRMQVSRIALKRHLSNINEIGPQELDFLLGEGAGEV